MMYLMLIGGIGLALTLIPLGYSGSCVGCDAICSRWCVTGWLYRHDLGVLLAGVTLLVFGAAGGAAEVMGIQIA